MTDKQRVAKLRVAVAALKKTTSGYHPTGVYWRKALGILAELEHDLEPSRVPNLGPVTPGGKSVLLQDLTHATGGLNGYPAFDDAFGAGIRVIAPEPLTVTRQSGARRRDGRPNGKAFYATGHSALEYWFGHVDIAPRVGARFNKGELMAHVSGNHEAPHLHVGIDARTLIGKELVHHTDYTHGAPTVGVQLAAVLEA
jgi:hypothetical protein